MSRFEYFFLAPASPRPLAALRIALAALLLLQAFLLRDHVLAFLAHDGLVQGGLAAALTSRASPHVAWLVEHLAPYGLAETTVIYGVCAAYVVSLLLMLLGLGTRAATIAVWFLHWMLTASAQTMVYGVDTYAHVFLFYLLFAPAGDALSLDRRLSGRPELPSPGARLALRAMQLHLAMSYLVSGLEKAQGPQWWNGELLWRALTTPIYQHYDLSWLAQWMVLSKAAGWMTLVAEVGYVVFIWPKRTRRLWVPLMVALHAGIAVMLGLTLFGTIMALLTLILFGLEHWSTEPRSWAWLFTPPRSAPATPSPAPAG